MIENTEHFAYAMRNAESANTVERGKVYIIRLPDGRVCINRDKRQCARQYSWEMSNA